MNDRFKKPEKKNKKTNIKNVTTYFFACEFKPGSELWSVLDGFAYDVKPAFIYGSLGVISYEPESYSIIDVNSQNQPLLGYICTITEPITASLVDKIKGYYGNKAFSYHTKKLVHAYTDLDNFTNAWAYVLSDYVLESYEQIEQIEFGIWDHDEKQIHLLEKIGESL
jgi:hypothetical protein